MNLVLANIDYRTHVTDEGDQLQRGLESAGWALCGHGYERRIGERDGFAEFAGNETDVSEILRTSKSDIVFVQDPRDWDRRHPGCFNHAVSFKNISALADSPAFKVVVVKDAGSCIDYQRDFAKQIGANAAAIYYHEQSVRRVAPWLSGMRLIRTYHSVDAATIAKLNLTKQRNRGIVTGAVSDVYPLRRSAFNNAAELGIDAIAHPGYGNNGCHTPGYLARLTGYRVHVATASRYHFALRKIIESVACGCTPVTNLPAYDRLPEIDEVLVRVPDNISVQDLKSAIDSAEQAWDADRAVYFSRKACEFYDWAAAGHRLNRSIMAEAGV
jgi:hypothetical protein